MFSLLILLHVGYSVINYEKSKIVKPKHKLVNCKIFICQITHKRTVKIVRKKIFVSFSYNESSLGYFIQNYIYGELLSGLYVE